jgi:hypothetical protein
MMVHSFSRYAIAELDIEGIHELPGPETVWTQLASVHLVPEKSIESDDEQALMNFCITLIDNLTSRELAVHVSGDSEQLVWKGIRWSRASDFATWWTESGHPDFVLADFTRHEGYSIQEEEYGFCAYRANIA